MNEKDFLKIYIPALEKALENDEINTGFHVTLPIDYVPKDISKSVEIYMDNNYDKFKVLFDMEAAYFDAKNHNFEFIDGVQTSEYRAKLFETIADYKRGIE